MSNPERRPVEAWAKASKDGSIVEACTFGSIFEEHDYRAVICPREVWDLIRAGLLAGWEHIDAPTTGSKAEIDAMQAALAAMNLGAGHLGCAP